MNDCKDDKPDVNTSIGTGDLLQHDEIEIIKSRMSDLNQRSIETMGLINYLNTIFNMLPSKPTPHQEETICFVARRYLNSI